MQLCYMANGLIYGAYKMVLGRDELGVVWWDVMWSIVLQWCPLVWCSLCSESVVLEDW